MLASQARVADTFVSRLIGLLNTQSLERGEGLYIAPCNQIHMFGMKYAIDVVFLDKSGNVVGLCDSIPPGQFSALYSKAYGCVELPAGIIGDTNTAIGDIVETGEAELAPGE